MGTKILLSIGPFCYSMTECLWKIEQFFYLSLLKKPPKKMGDPKKCARNSPKSLSIMIQWDRRSVLYIAFQTLFLDRDEGLYPGCKTIDTLGLKLFHTVKGKRDR